jgi:hypothetical protein
MTVRQMTTSQMTIGHKCLGGRLLVHGKGFRGGLGSLWVWLYDNLIYLWEGPNHAHANFTFWPNCRLAY